ncbi:MAG: hypothetical protein WCF63_00095 [Acidimicrobiales bacterium]
MSIVTDPTTTRESRTSPSEVTTSGPLELLFREAKHRARRRRWRGVGLALAIVLTAGVVAAVAYGVSGPTSRGGSSVPPLAVGTSAGVLTCQGTDVTRPSNFVITCADAYTQLTQTHWTSWTSKRAVGTTTFAMNLCKPYCAASKMTYYPGSTVSFTSPVTTKHGSLFSLLTVRYRSGGRPRVFRFSYRGDPSFK